MKHVFSKILTGMALLAAFSCTDEIPEVIDEISLGRCLTPTNVTANVQNGEYIYFSADQSKTTSQFVIELYSDSGMTGSPVKTTTIDKADVPYLYHVEADEVYYLRVKAISDGSISDSNWYVYEKALQTTAIKSSLNPEVVNRTDNSIEIKWTADPEVDHIRVTPKLSDSDEDYTKISVSSDEIAAGTKTISSLKPSVKYTVTVHFKSADRGSVIAWTLPNTTGATEVSDTAALKQAVKDGAEKILVKYSDTVYEVGEMNLTKPLSIYGEQNAEGTYPTVAGRFTFDPAKAGSLHAENLTLSGAAQGTMSQQTHVVTTTAAGAMTSISFLNCNIDGYQRGLYYDNYGNSVDSFTFDNCVISNITGDGGDCFDVRKAATLTSVAFTNSTIYEGMRTFLRIDSAATLGTLEISSCTLSNLTTSIHSNNNGLLHIRAAATAIVLKNNLFLNMTGDEYCQLVGHNSACKLPTEMSGNFYYNCQDGFFTHIIETVENFGVDKAVANGGAVLTEDPCVDSGNATFNLTNAALIAAGAGDPRWFSEYVEVPEDLTLAVTKAVKSWDFSDGKTFYKAADKDMVRDGIRFYVKNSPVAFSSEGLSFSAAGKVGSDGVPTDCGMGIKVDEPGSIVVSTSGTNDQAILAVSLDGKVKAAVPVGSENVKVVFDAITSGEEHMIYFYGTAPITVSALQWSDDIETAGASKLDTPAPSISKTEINEGTDETLTVSWDAVAKAGSYDVIFNAKTSNVTDAKFDIAAKTLAAGEYTVKVVALPASTDRVRQASDTASVAFTVKEILKAVSATAPTTWGADYMTAGIAKYGTGDLTADFIYGNLGYVAGGGKFKFGTDNADDPAKAMNRVQLGGTGAAGTKSNIQFIAGSAGTLTIVARSSGDATTQRPLAVAVGSAKVESFVTVDKTQDPATYTYEVASSAGDLVNIYSEKSGINLYSITWTPKEKASSLSDETAINETYLADYSNTTTFPEGDVTENTTIEKVTYMATSTNKITFNSASKRIKFNGASSVDANGVPSDRCAMFKIVKPGTVTFKLISGSSSDATRNATVLLVTKTSEGTKYTKLYDANADASSSADARTVEVTADHLSGITEAAQVYVFGATKAVNLYGLGFTPAN